MGIIIAIMKKELQEMTYSKKPFVIFFITLLLPPLFITFFNNPQIPKEIFLTVLPLLLCFFGAMEFSFPLMIEEVNNKTIEVLLASRIPRILIILGKVLVPTLVGMLGSITCMIILKIVASFLPGWSNYNINSLLIFILGFFISYICSTLTIIITSIFPDFRTAQSINFYSTIITGFMFVAIIYYFYKKFILGIMMMILISVILTFLATYILAKNRHLITK